MTPKSFVSNFLGVIPKNFTFLPAFFYYGSKDY